MLDAAHARVRQQLLGVVVDQLPTHEHVGLVRQDLRHLRAHLRLLRLLDLRHLRDAVHTHARAVNLDLVTVHRRVRQQHARMLPHTLLTHAETLLQNETLLQI